MRVAALSFEPECSSKSSTGICGTGFLLIVRADDSDDAGGLGLGNNDVDAAGPLQTLSCASDREDSLSVDEGMLVATDMIFRWCLALTLSSVMVGWLARPLI